MWVLKPVFSENKVLKQHLFLEKTFAIQELVDCESQVTSPGSKSIHLHRKPISGIAEGILNRHRIIAFENVKRDSFSA